jgi:hypothetical protein
VTAREISADLTGGKPPSEARVLPDIPSLVGRSPAVVLSRRKLLVIVLHCRNQA